MPNARTPRSWPLLFVAALALTAAAACSGGGEATPTPTTAPVPLTLPMPTPTAAPEAAATPTPAPLPPPIGPVDFSTWRNQDLGASFRYPSAWEQRVSEDPGVWATFSDSDTGASLSLLVEFVPLEMSLQDRLDAAIDRETPADIDNVNVVRYDAAALADGTEAMRADIVFARSGETFVSRLQVAQRGSLTLTLVLHGDQAVFDRWAGPLAATLDSLSVFPPTPYGVRRESAFIMPLGEPATLDPAIARETISHLFVSALFSGLVRLGNDLEVEPDLAEYWEVDDSGTVYTFTLRDGIAFHDGRPITAHDFKYSIERAADPGLHSDTAPLYLGDIVGMHQRLEGEASEAPGVEVVDTRTLRITIDAPKQYFLAKLTYPVAAVVDRESVEGRGDEWWLDAPITGSGPYKLMLWEEGEAVVLKRNDDYHSPADLEYLVSPSTRLPGASALAMYHSYAWDAVSVGLGSLDFVRETPVLNAEFQEFDQLTTSFIVLDSTRPPFDDLNVRRAFGMALDREALIKEIYGGGVTLARGLLPPGMPGYSAFLRSIPYDPEAARQALARSAYAGDFPPVTFSALDDGGEAPPSVQFMLATWEDTLGIEVGVDLIDPEVYSYELESAATHLFTYGWVADYPDPENFLDLLLHSSAHDARYANPSFDRLVEQARVETDRETRLALYNQAEQLLIDDAGIIPLFHVKDYVLVAPYVRGFDVTVVGQPDIGGITLGAIAR